MIEERTGEMGKGAQKILIYGYGNPGRQDDALGIRLCEIIEDWKQKNKLNNVDIDQSYQLNIEDAEVVSKYDLVIFIDASVNEIESFKFDKLLPSIKTEFSMHSVSPAFVLGLCQQIYGWYPECYQLEIKGHEWEFMKPISVRGQENLIAAENFLKSIIEKTLKPVD